MELTEAEKAQIASFSVIHTPYGDIPYTQENSRGGMTPQQIYHRNIM